MDPENATTGSARPEAQRRGTDGGEAEGAHAAFTAQVAQVAHQADCTVNALAGHHGLHPTLIHGWEKQLVTGAESIFGSPAQAAPADAEARQAERFESIGRLKRERKWVKKNAATSM